VVYNQHKRARSIYFLAFTLLTHSQTFQMDQQIKQLWVGALRSKEYKQGQNWLKKGDDFCCLGVLCDLYLSENSREWKARDDEEEPSEIYDEDEYLQLTYSYDSFDEFSVDNNTEMLPKSVAKWAGINEDTVYCDGCVSVRGETLTGLNDSGHSFDEIASIIEECL